MNKTTKKCYICKEEKTKSLDNFYADKSRSSGLSSNCKKCYRTSKYNPIKAKERVKRYRLKYPEKNRELYRLSYIKGKKQKQEYKKKWYLLNKHKVRAHRLVGRALKNGLLLKESCSKCGTIRSVAHHEDYSKPLEIIWLCQRCHVIHHRTLC